MYAADNPANNTDPTGFFQCGNGSAVDAAIGAAGLGAALGAFLGPLGAVAGGLLGFALIVGPYGLKCGGSTDGFY